MEDTMTTGMEQTPDQEDAFLAGWDDAEPVDTPADQPEDGGEAQSGGETGDDTSALATGETGTETGEGAADTDGGEPGQSPQAQKPGEETPKATSPSWNIRHNGEERTLTAEQVTPELLQKGLDYDRVRERYDEMKPVMDMVSDLANRSGLSTAEYVRLIRAKAKEAAGMSADEAKRTVELEDREAAISAQEAVRKADQAAQTAQRARIAADLAEFGRAFPQVSEQAKSDPKAIPDSVWADVRSGMSLTAAYSRYAVAQAEARAQEARTQAETAGKNAENAARSTGSMKTAGQDTKSKDPFLEGWGD